MDTPNSTQDFEPLIKADEVADFLGFKPITIRRMAAKGQLPSIAFPSGNGKFTHRFRKSELVTYLTALQQKKPSSATGDGNFENK